MNGDHGLPGIPPWLAWLFGAAGSGTAIVLYRIGLKLFKPAYAESVRLSMATELATLRDELQRALEARHQENIERLHSIEQQLEWQKNEIRAIDSMTVSIGARQIQHGEHIAKIEGYIERRGLRRGQDVA